MEIYFFTEGITNGWVKMVEIVMIALYEFL